MTQISATEDWFAYAACFGTDTEDFYPKYDIRNQGQGRIRELAAKQICRGCVVRKDCLEYALLHDEQYGVWGGMSPEERHQERKRRIIKGTWVDPIQRPMNSMMAALR